MELPSVTGDNADAQRIATDVYLYCVVICRTWALILGMAGLIVAFWFIAEGEALRFLVSQFLFHSLTKALVMVSFSPDPNHPSVCSPFFPRIMCACVPLHRFPPL